MAGRRANCTGCSRFSQRVDAAAGHRARSRIVSWSSSSGSSRRRCTRPRSTSNIRVLMVTSAEPGDGKSTDRRQPGADVERVVPAPRAADRRRSAAARRCTRSRRCRTRRARRDAQGDQRAEAAARSSCPTTLMLLPAGPSDPDPMGGLTSPPHAAHPRRGRRRDSTG